MIETFNFTINGLYLGTKEFSLKVNIMVSNWQIERFFRENGFELWKVKMQTILIQEKCIEILKDETLMHARSRQAEKIKVVDKSISVIIVCLMDKFLREVAKDNITASMGEKLGSLYMKDSLSHRLCLK